MSAFYPPKDERLLNNNPSISEDALCFGKRMDGLERGKVYEFAIAVNHRGKKTWTLRQTTKLENDE